MAPQNAPNWDAELQVYEPHRAGLPALRPYFRDLRQRLPFAAAFSKSGIKAAHSETVFGQAWLVLNPTLLAGVYFFMIKVLSRGGSAEGLEVNGVAVGGMLHFAHIAGGIFIFYFFSGSVSSGAGSVTTGGRLILNMAFPRLLMPLAAVRTAFFRFLPTIPVYILLLVLAKPPWSPTMLLAFYFLICLALFSIGMAAFFAALQVYFRDTTSFLPYFLRIWLYVSPILWFPEQATETFPDIAPLMVLNPLHSLIGGWSDLTLLGAVPPASLWIAAAAWALIALVGGSLFFMSRERDFAVRI